MIDLQKLADRYYIVREKQTVWFTYHDFECFIRHIASHEIKLAFSMLFLGATLSYLVLGK